MAAAKNGFESTLSSFKNHLTQKELANFQFSTLEEVQSLVARIQAEQGSQKNMMNFTRLQSFLEAMSQFGEVIEVFLNASEFVAFVWGPLKFVLKVLQHCALALHSPLVFTSADTFISPILTTKFLTCESCKPTVNVRSGSKQLG